MTCRQERFANNMIKSTPPLKAACPDLLTGVMSMAYVMCYNHLPPLKYCPPTILVAGGIDQTRESLDR